MSFNALVVPEDPTYNGYILKPEPFLRSHGNVRAAGGGREALMRETLTNYPALLRLCPELAELEQRMRLI